MSPEKFSRDYSVYGLTIRSALPLPELFPAASHAVPDVVVRRGSIPVADGAPSGLSSADGALLLVVEGIARYRISDGNTIIVEPFADVAERNVRLFLLGSAFGALLHQRGLLPLHANAIEFDGTAVAFMGPSGAGKSTLAAWFHDRGHRVISDDLCVVGFNASEMPYAAPGLPRLRLWAEAVELMGRETADYARSYAGDETFDKFDVPIAPEGATTTNLPLVAVYVLERGDEFAVAQLHGMAAAEAVFAHTYRGSYLSAISGQQRHWEMVMRLVRHRPVFRVVRKWGLARLGEQCSTLLEHVRAGRSAFTREQSSA